MDIPLWTIHLTMTDKHSLERALKRLGRTLDNPHITAERLMTDLEWVDRRTPDKRRRPPEAKRAVKWLQERGLWDTYKREYPDNSAKKRAYNRYNKKRQGRNVTVYVANPEQEKYLAENRQPDEAESAAIKRLAGFPKD